MLFFISSIQLVHELPRTIEGTSFDGGYFSGSREVVEGTDASSYSVLSTVTLNIYYLQNK